MPNAKRFRRLDQLFSQLGYGSRNDCKVFIREDRILVKGCDRITASDRVDPAAVLIDDLPLDHPDGLLILLNKPVGYVCSHDIKEGATVYELLPDQWNFRSPQVVSVGRLDKDTSGLLLLTDQSELVHRLTSPKKHVSKLYDVRFEGVLPADAVELCAAGTMLLEGESKACLPARLKVVEPAHAQIEITEGRFHQVRRMFAALGVTVTRLQRLRFADLDLAGVEEGKFRLLPLDYFEKATNDHG